MVERLQLLGQPKSMMEQVAGIAVAAGVLLPDDAKMRTFGRASVYKIINDYYPNAMGSVGGFVAALGALGGCTLPIVFGVAVDLVGIYSVCFMVLYAVLALCMIVMFFANKADRFQQRLHQAQSLNFLEQD